MKLHPIHKDLDDNTEFAANPHCQDTLYANLDFYKRIGFNPPWISYYARVEGELAGTCAFKGKPVNGTVEIAYYTFEHMQHKGIATQMCKALVNLSLATDATIKIKARTLPENNYSTKVLEKNGFVLAGPVMDPEDGEVWEWVYRV